MMPNLLATLSLLAESPLDHVVDHPIIGVFTNHMLLLLVSGGLMLLVFPKLTRPYRSGELVPTGTRNFFEAILVYVREDIARPVLAEHTDQFISFLWTLFFFILINNLMGLLPIDSLTGPVLRAMLGQHTAGGVLGGHVEHGAHRHGFGGTATANIYVTGALALVSFVVTQVAGIRANGIVNYLKHFTAGAPVYMAPILVPVEIIGMIVKPVALMIRLFANMSAGHILLAVLIGFVAKAYEGLGVGGAIGVGIPSIVGATAISCLEVFVAFLQAYLFTFLTALFIGQLVVHDHEHEAHDEHDHAHHGKEAGSLESGDMTDHSLPEKIRHA